MNQSEHKGAITVSSSETVTDLLRRYGVDPASKSVAVAVNGVVVRRHDWSSYVAIPGDTVEIVRPFQGG